MKSTSLIFSIAAVMGLSSCGNNSNETDSVEKSSLTLSDAVTAEKVQKIYALPSAMQVSSFLTGVDKKYHENFLTASLHSNKSPLNTVQKALSLGIFGVDLGYTVSYDQDQSSINYLVKIAKISDDLKISGAFSKETVERFKNNISNTDSLTFITLSSFNDASNFLRNNNNTDVQYLVAAGAFIEGAYLISSAQKTEKKQEIANVIGMQKLYLGNILELLSPFAEKQAEIKTTVEQLEKISKAFEAVNVEVVSGTEGNPQSIKDVEISDQQLDAILKEVTEMRKSILG